MLNPHCIKWIYIEVKKRMSGMFKRLLVIRTLTDINGIRLNGQVIIKLPRSQKGTLRM